jgi:hypothetical protein
MQVGFGGTASAVGDYACAIGMAQSMGSENTFVGCYVAVGDRAGISWHNFNALAGTVIGGNMASHSLDGIHAVIPSRGIYVIAGACPIIQGVSFQNYDGIDIDIENGATDAYAITGCRTESVNFIKAPPDLAYFIAGCTMTSPHAPGSGFFFSGGGRATIETCSSAGGHYIEGQNASVIIRNSSFVDANYLSAGANENYNYLEIHPMPIKEVTHSRYTIMSYDGGHKLEFNLATAQTVTLNKNSDYTCRLGPGTKIEVQQIGVGQTTFQGAAGVTIRSANGLKLRARYSCAVLTCDGADTWTLTGDTAV